MKVKAAIKERDLGWKALATALKSIKQGDSYVKAGVFDSRKPRRDDTGLTNAELATIHEFGAPSANIPERSFIRSSFEKHKQEYFSALRGLLQLVYEQKMTIEQALGIMGLKMSADMKKGITEGAGIPPPNTPEVFLRKLRKNKKGFDRTGAAPRPLVDTGQLLNAITHVVVMQGGEKK